MGVGRRGLRVAQNLVGGVQTACATPPLRVLSPGVPVVPDVTPHPFPDTASWNSALPVPVQREHFWQGEHGVIGTGRKEETSRQEERTGLGC